MESAGDRSAWRCLAVAVLVAVAPNGAARAEAAADPAPPQQGLIASRGSVGGFGGLAAGIGEGLDSGPTFGASLVVYFIPNLGIEAAVQRQSVDLGATGPNLLSGGVLDSTLVTAGIVARFAASARATPYVAGGIAYFSNDYQIDATLVAELADFNFVATESIDDKLGFNVGGGIDVRVAGPVTAFGEARYFVATVDTSAELRDIASGIASSLEGEQDLARVAVTAGLRVVF